MGVQTPLRLDLAAGDFVLLAAPPPWTLAHGAPTRTLDFQRPPGAEDRLDAVIDPTGASATGAGATGASPTGASARLIGGHIGFAAADARLLAGLAPPVIHIRAGQPGAERLRGLLALIDDESAAARPGRALVLDRLLEVMLAEALRCGVAAGPEADPALTAPEGPGLLAGLADPRVAAALAAFHADIRRPWTVADLAAVAGASRSAFAERFTRRLGLAPARYLLQWRMALAKDALREAGARVEAVAFAVGYGSASAFSTAFTREVGCAPGRWAGEGGLERVGLNRNHRKHDTSNMHAAPPREPAINTAHPGEGP